jgi:GH15 family glucan-1,4-alpha-glucosidase
MAYKPIESYGMIGDMHSVALVGTDGSIDWLCLPRFDSPSVFGALLDDGKGGFFRIAPTDPEVTARQFYWPETNVLVTRFMAPHGAVELTDFMPVGDRPDPRPHRHELVRRITAVRGAIRLRMDCRPAFDYARARHDVRLLSDGAAFEGPGLTLGLATRTPLTRDGGGVCAEFTLNQGEAAVFVLRQLSGDEGCGLSLSEDEAEAAFRDTVAYWRAWLARCQYRGRWREMVERSALALKLLTYEPTGAIVAAPTCSLPEAIGGGRNWDYRYAWIRDAAFTLYAFLRLGFSKEAERFMHFLSGICLRCAGNGGPESGFDGGFDGALQIMYGIDGRRDLAEQTLDHLDGYCGSRPVRIGNGAYGQLQLDIYGALLDAAYLFNKYGEPISYSLWSALRRMVDWVCANWRRPDDGVWEVRDGQRQFVYSKLMCWVAIDRGLRLSEKRSLPADRRRWYAERDAIYEEIMDRGWNERRGAFVQAYGSDALDASVLMMPLTFFLSPTDPRMLQTLDAILEPPERGGLAANSLVYRYNVSEAADGVDGDEGTFNICTFWLVEALTRAGRFKHHRLDDARIMFERMLGFANHVGLFAEETGFRGEALGNYPQAFTHLALISAAFNLDRALGAEG